jgi:hypothetical protein
MEHVRVDVFSSKSHFPCHTLSLNLQSRSQDRSSVFRFLTLLEKPHADQHYQFQAPGILLRGCFCPVRARSFRALLARRRVERASTFAHLYLLSCDQK